MSKRNATLAITALSRPVEIRLPAPASHAPGRGDRVITDADRLDYMASLVSELKDMAASGGFARAAFLLAEAEAELQLQIAAAG